MTKYFGEEVPTLNDGWTLFGAKLDEWLAGASGGILYITIVQSFFRDLQASDAVILLLCTCGVTYILRILRERFPDEKRGIMHALCDKIGVCPPDIPPPANFRAYWSEVPCSRRRDTELCRLGFDRVIIDIYVKDSGKAK